MTDHERVHFLFASQKVKDIKLPNNDPIAMELGRLRHGMKQYAFIPGEKIPVDLKPRSVDQDGVFHADIPGDQLASVLDITIHGHFPLNLQYGSMVFEEEKSGFGGIRIDFHQNDFAGKLQSRLNELKEKVILEEVFSNAEGTSVDDELILAQLEVMSDEEIGRVRSKLNAICNAVIVESVFSSADGVRIDDGGNIQNQLINTLTALHHANIRELLQEHGADLRVTVGSSSDPFKRISDQFADSLRQTCDVFEVDLLDRFAIQGQCADYYGGKALSITSEPKRMGSALEELLQSVESFRDAFKDATVFVSADPLYAQLSAYAKPPYTYIINASSALRSIVANESYSKSVILPMNAGEAAEVSKLLEARKFIQELDKTDRPPFPSPLEANGVSIDRESLRQLDQSLHALRAYIPLNRHHNRIGISCPVTFDQHGGLVIGTGKDEIACFASTPHPDKEQRLLEEFGDSSTIDMSRIYDVGAGDSAATMVTLFQGIDPQIFIQQHLEGREHEERSLKELASLIFVNTLSRIAGNFLVRTRSTYWDNIHPSKFRSLFDETAKEALQAARHMYKPLNQGPVLKSIDRWGIQLLAWELGSQAYPERK